MLFDRVYKLIVGKAGNQTGFEITDLRIKFNIQKTISKNPNKNSVQIWNLAPATRSELEKPGTRCILYAGYSEDAGPLLIFTGNVTFASTKYDLPDVITTFELGDGEAEYRNSHVSLGYPPNADTKQIIRDIARQMGLPVNFSNEAGTSRYPNGMSHHGAARNALTRVCAAAGLTWSIQNGQIEILQAGGGTSRQAIVLAADSGLIDTPERERKESAEQARVRDQTTNENRNIVSAARQEDGWRVKSLLMPTINAGDQVKLESRTIKEVLIAAEVQHNADNMEGDWQTTLKLVTVATAAAIRAKEAKRVADAAKTATRRAAHAAAHPTGTDGASRATTVGTPAAGNVQ